MAQSFSGKRMTCIKHFERKNEFKIMFGTKSIIYKFEIKCLLLYRMQERILNCNALSTNELHHRFPRASQVMRLLSSRGTCSFSGTMSFLHGI